LLLEDEGVLHGGSLKLLLHGLERLYLLHGLEGERLVVHASTSFTPRHARTAPTKARISTTATAHRAQVLVVLLLLLLVLVLLLLQGRRLHVPHGLVVGLGRGAHARGGAPVLAARRGVEVGANGVTLAAHLTRGKVHVVTLRAQPIPRSHLHLF
jgi:hypothetical protein